MRRNYWYLVVMLSSVLILFLCTFTVWAQSTVTFDNQSGEPARVRLIGPTSTDVGVPNGGKTTVTIGAGRYYIKVRYGTEGKYHYAEGQEFDVLETANTRSEITITLHKVVGGNFELRPISEQEFNQSSLLLKPMTPGRMEQATRSIDQRGAVSNLTDTELEGILTEMAWNYEKGTTSAEDWEIEETTKDSPEILRSRGTGTIYSFSLPECQYNILYNYRTSIRLFGLFNLNFPADRIEEWNRQEDYLARAIILKGADGVVSLEPPRLVLVGGKTREEIKAFLADWARSIKAFDSFTKEGRRSVQDDTEIKTITDKEVEGLLAEAGWAFQKDDSPRFEAKTGERYSAYLVWMGPDIHGTTLFNLGSRIDLFYLYSNKSFKNESESLDLTNGKTGKQIKEFFAKFAQSIGGRADFRTESP